MLLTADGKEVYWVFLGKAGDNKMWRRMRRKPRRLGDMLRMDHERIP